MPAGRKTLGVSTGIELMCLPAATPELQPAEYLWPLLREAVANQTFASLELFQETQVEGCLQLVAQVDAMQSAVNFQWLPTA